jgi:hypothetical protein
MFLLREPNVASQSWGKYNPVVARMNATLIDTAIRWPSPTIWREKVNKLGEPEDQRRAQKLNTTLTAAKRDVMFAAGCKGR